MTYTANVPQSGQTLGFTRPLINSNFQVINTAFAVNHVAFNVAGAGKHKFVEMPVTTDKPAVIGQGTLYSKATGVGNDAQLFWRFANAALSPLQLTNNFFNLIASPGATPLPGGLLVQWGVNTVASGGTTSFYTEFSSGGVATNPFIVIPQIFQNTTNRHFVYTKTISPTGFTTTNLDSGGSAESNTFFWIAIGPKN